MIRAGDVRINRGGLQPLPQRLRAEKVIDPSTDVPRAGGAHLAPPRIVAAVLFKGAEGIDKPCFDKGVEAGALLRREAMVLHVVLWSREIDLGVRHIQIATPDDRLFLLELLEIRQ